MQARGQRTKSGRAPVVMGNWEPDSSEPKPEDRRAVMVKINNNDALSTGTGREHPPKRKGTDAQ